jgi:hypothetical protein
MNKEAACPTNRLLVVVGRMTGEMTISCSSEGYQKNLTRWNG